MLSSRQFASEGSVHSCDNTLPSSCVVAAVMWEIELLIREAQLPEPDPGNNPDGPRQMR